MSKQIYDEVIRKLMQLPRPFDPLPGGISGDVLAYFNQLGMSPPHSYVEWLGYSNGAYVDSQNLLGLCGRGGLGIQLVYDLFPSWINNGFIPVASDGLGNYYAIDTHSKNGQNAPVVFFDHEESMEKPAYIVASDFKIFLPNFIKKEVDRSYQWPFNKEVTKEIDPNITIFTDLPKAYEI